MAIKIGSLLIRLAVEHGILQEGLARSERDIAKTTKAIERRAKDIADFGKKMALAVALPMAAIAKASIDGAIAQRQAVAQVESAIASMGNVAGRTTQQLVANADAMEMRSLYDADVILKQVTANLLTFGNIAGEQFDRAQQAAIDMATRLGTEPQAAAIMLGKALNDPIRGLTALGKNGTIQKDWIAANKARIAAMVEEGRIAEAQTLILVEVEKQYRGAAAAAADADPYRQFQVILGQIGDTIGEALLPYILQLRDAVMRNREAIFEAAQGAIDFVGSLVRLVQSLSPLIGGFIAYRAALIAASVVQTAYVAGMTTFAFAVSAARGATVGLNAALLANPFTAAAVAVGVLTTAFISMRNAQSEARAETNNLITSLKALAGARSADFYQKRAEGAIELAVKEARLAKLERDLAGQRGVAGGYAAQALFPQIRELRKEITVLGDGLSAADRELARAQKAAQAIVVPAGQAATAVSGLGREARAAGGGARAGAEDFKRLYDRLYPFQAASRQFAEDMALIQQSRLSDAEKEATISRLESEAFRSRTRGLGDATVSSWLTRDEPLVDFGKQLDDLQDQLGAAAKVTRDKTVQIAQSFREMAERSLQALNQMVSAIRGGDFLDILTSVIGFGLQLGSSGAFGKTVAGFLNAPQIPGRANGTAYHPGGLMKVGERGPEILQVPRGGLPNHELRDAGQAAAAHITVGIDPRNGNITAFVNGQIAATAPLVANLGAQQAQNQAARSAQRRVR